MAKVPECLDVKGSGKNPFSTPRPLTFITLEIKSNGEATLTLNPQLVKVVPALPLKPAVI